ncbi:membrane glycoprotein UL18 [Human betaherpesvirus 5]|uniref:Membrane glycoprotein UL18 n=1 Tax=Human cytomegalovirus TaxID=10359 RepID=A0A0G2U750_HCMV|nr:membrane glycoprotein UL18 [Human betaherpesvirus 5]
MMTTWCLTLFVLWMLRVVGMHVLRYGYTGIFGESHMTLTVVGIFDGQHFFTYHVNSSDRTSSRANGTISWMANVSAAYPTYLDGERAKGDLIFNQTEQNLLELEIALGYQSQSVLTWIHECNTTENGSFVAGYEGFGWDGETLMELKDNLTLWTGPNYEISWLKQNKTYIDGKIKNISEEDTTTQRNYLKGNCTQWSVIYSGFQTPVTHPVVKGGVRNHNDNRAEAFCTSYGFFPGEINITFIHYGDKVPEDSEPQCNPLLPTFDGTFHQGCYVAIFCNQNYTCRVTHGNWTVEIPISITSPDDSSSGEVPDHPTASKRYNTMTISSVLLALLLCALLFAFLHYFTTLKQYLRNLAFAWRYRKVRSS